MNVKVSQLKSRLKHSEHFDSEISAYLSSVEEKLNDKLCFADLSDYDCDLKLIFVETGGSEGLFLQNLNVLQEPYYLLTNGDNNSLAASIEILTYLRQAGKRGEILHGTADYVAKRIKSLAVVSRVKKQLANTRLGVIGAPSDWLIASVPNYSAVKNKLGVTLVDIPVEEVEQEVNSANYNAYNVDGYPAFDKTELRKAVAVKCALAKIIKRYNLDGLTIRCFDLLTSINTTGCLALAELNAEGITATCEGDVATMLSMHVIKLLTNMSSFQANPSHIDVENNTVTFAHCTIPLDMTDGYSFDTHFESGKGVAIKGNVRQQDVTLLRISADLSHYFVCGGKIVSNLSESNLCRTQVVFKGDKNVAELLTNPCGNHHVIAYGNFADEIAELLDELLA